MARWKKLPPITEPQGSACLNCPPRPIRALMRTKVGVGFVDAHISRDGVRVWSEFRPGQPREWERLPRLSRFEREAKADPDHDWRLVLSSPMSYAEYQRQGPGTWLLVKSGPGFA